MNYFLHILIMLCIYFPLSGSLNLLVGFTGMMSICHAAFYGIGGYISALAMMQLGVPFFLALLLAAVGGGLIAALISAPCIRLKGDYFILGTIGFQVIVYRILYNWVAVTRGPFGIPGIPAPVVFGREISSLPMYLLMSATVAVGCLILIYLIVSSPFGRALKAVREDETAAQALGYNTIGLKILVFGIAGGFAAVSGSLYAHYVTFIDPTSFTIDEAIFLISIVIVGGLGTLKGPVIGTVVMFAIPEMLRFLKIPDAMAANTRQIIYGVLLILLIRFRPQGIAGEAKL